MDKEKIEKALAELEEFRKLFDSDPETYRFKIASRCYTLGFLCQHERRYAQAKSYYQESLGHYRVLSSENSDKYSPAVAFVCYNLGTVLMMTPRQIDEAEKLYVEALDIFLKLSETNPEKYKEHAANTARKLSALYLQKQTEMKLLAKKLNN